MLDARLTAGPYSRGGNTRCVRRAPALVRGYEPDFFLQSGQRFLSIPPCHAPHFVHVNVAVMGKP